MKNLIILNAVNAGKYSAEKSFGGKSSFDLCLDWAENIVSKEDVYILTNDESSKYFNLPDSQLIAINEEFTVAKLFSILASLSEKADNLIYAFASCPFYNLKLTKDLMELHEESQAEYCFADGYSYGFSPEILNSGSVRILNSLAENNEKWKSEKVGKDSIFELLKTDINSFEIETLIADNDYRANRFSFDCKNKNNSLLCSRLYENAEKKFGKNISEIDVEELSLFSESLSCLQKVLPAYYNIQICAGCSGKCSFCPYPKAFEEKYRTEVCQDRRVMDYKDFSLLVDKIADFSEEAVLCLSLWGESILHPELEKFVEKVLSYSGLSVLIEMSGRKLPAEKINQIEKIVNAAEKRSNGWEKIYWIVSCDAQSPELYDALHFPQGKENQDDSLENSLANIAYLSDKFPKCVYPQFLRLNENEKELENFFRYWNEKNEGRLIIKKYDYVSGLLEQKKTADLAPLTRNVCWHLRRDMVILFDGSVPLCQDFLLNSDQGNVFTDSLEEIWKKRDSEIENQMNGKYNSICGKCDEYYIYNF
ncbi:MAG: spiro-SPASM protein [Treponemataceae bacterium]|nr:spiro-SPASM protein [Treponemataceae bacterium]